MAKTRKAPPKPKLTAEQRKAQREANEHARDQFAALGRYIQNFEEIVSVLRWHCHRIMLGDNLGINNPDERVMLYWWNITSMIFHHEVFTAKALADIWRSLLAEQCKALKSLEVLSEEGDKVVKGITREIANEFEDIYQERNRLLHATWRIGRWPSFEEFSELVVEKYRVGAEGFARRTDLPKTFEELMELGNRCLRLHGKLGRFLQFYHYRPQEIENVFFFTKTAEKWRKWEFVAPTAAASPDTSREKSR